MTYHGPDNDEYFARLSAFIDGTLDAEERAALVGALEADEALRGELAALRRMDELVRGSVASVPGWDERGFVAEARARREDIVLRPATMTSRPARFSLRRMVAPLAAAAGLALLVTAGVLWHSVTGGDRDPSGPAIAIVTVERGGPGRAEARAVRVDAWVQVSHTQPAVTAAMGPPAARRTLVISVASDPAADHGQADEDAGYF